MSLTSLSFLGVYFPLLLIAYYNPIWKQNWFRKLILLGAGLGLYTFSEPKYILLLMGIIILNYVLVKISDRMHNDVGRGVAIIIDVSILLGFKYINKLLEISSTNEFSKIAIPIGISYFTFKAISYVVDSKKIKEGSFIDVAIYISNFLTIVSGPLSTYEHELGMIREKTDTNANDIYNGVERLCIGLAKKVIIADSLSALANQAFSSSDLSFVMAWSGAIAYTLQLYFDFAGYTDMTIGLGTLFGFKLPENFNYPYMATSISDFWKRWHISLTKWFTKYIYIPLGGSRVKGSARHIFNLFVVWLVTGMWHGSSMTFIVWAMIYFILQTLEKYTKLAEYINKVHLGHIYTMLVVIIEWVIFRSDSLTQAFTYIGSMFMLNGNGLIHAYEASSIFEFIIPLTLGILFATNIGVRIKEYINTRTYVLGTYHVVLLALYIVCIIISISQGYTAPLYAGF